MISLPYVKARLAALISARSELDGIKVLYAIAENASELEGDRDTVDGVVMFVDSLEEIAGDITRESSCGWVEQYDLPVHVQFRSISGDLSFEEIEQHRRRAQAAVLAVLQDPTLGLASNPDPDGYVASLEVRPSTVTSGTSYPTSEKGAPVKVSWSDLALEVRAEMNPQ